MKNILSNRALRTTTLMLLLAVAPKLEAARYVTEGGYPACLTEENFEEAIQALVASDTDWFLAIDGCIITKPGLKLTLVDYGLGRSQVRIHPPEGGRPILMWTNSENLKKLY